ncbi:zinc ribbon domain-containing protein [Halorarius halobius]|uniref:zinc ribbon domain-containing protein n=1 Tax=Halorarius halobius TaxID=2962671 RepID=UPI0020CE064E|nr:zinc ribbon domain-containing protein [Halorarius halobius]
MSESPDEPSTSDESSPSDERGPDEVFCRNCGAVISEEAEICPECGVRQRDPPKSSIDETVEELFEGGNPFVAALLSALFPGLGQIYNRELEKGLVVIVASILAAFSMVFLVGIVLFPAVWLYAIYDAYTVADRQREAADDAAAE